MTSTTKTALDLTKSAMEEYKAKMESSNLYKRGAEQIKGQVDLIWTQVQAYLKSYTDGLDYITTQCALIAEEEKNPKTREGAKEQLKNLLDYKSWFETRIKPGFDELIELRNYRREQQRATEDDLDKSITKAKDDASNQLLELTKRLLGNDC